MYSPIGFKSDYSLLKSLLKIKDIINYAKSHNSRYVGILDDNLYGIMDFYDKCKKNNMKCIFGMIVRIGEYKIYLYIKDYNGYKNLIKINELQNENKLTLNDILKYNDGLMLVLPYENYNLFNRLKAVFEVYLGYKNQDELRNAYLITKNVVFINEIYYLKKEESKLLEILYKIAGEEYINGPNYVLEASEFDIKTVDDFISNIELKFDFSNRFIPVFCNSEEESIIYLRNLSKKGLAKRLNGNVLKEYSDRLNYELSVIEKMGYVDYFLIVYDYVKYAKKNNILVGPGRGSAAGSLVSYTLGITEIDPIKYDLLFERFLNPERITMPDIDIDFEDTRRGEVIDYVRSRYGENRVSLIVAYGTLGSKQVIRDTCKVFEIDIKLVDSLSKLIDAKKSLKENLKNNKLVDFIKMNKLEKVYKVSMRLEGLKKHTTIHAAGVVISSQILTEIIPTFKTNDGVLTGYTMEYLEKLGLLKMDFLALRNLTIIHNIIDLIHKKNKDFNLKNISLTDEKTFDIFKKGDTDKIFQFESPGMKNFLKKLSPSKFDDLVAANALFRPGPMQNIDEYINRKKGISKIDYLHPDLEPILKNTYGIIVYQEQIMQILSLMGGYSFAEADLIRRAMSKKKHDVMIDEKNRFIEKAIAKGYTKDIAIKVYDLILQFADYGFNKSHSVSYALIGYQMAYLKANYKDLFQVNNLNMNTSSAKTIKEVIEDAKNRGFMIVKPDINKSSFEYVIENNKVILPLTSIKDISANISKVIIENAPYNDIFDFFKKVYGNSINRKVVETLIKADAFNSLGYSRNTLLENIDGAINYIDLVKSLDETLVMKPEIIESNQKDEAINEIEIFGFYISGHPASKIKDAIKIKNIGYFKNRQINMGVLVDKIKVINTKKGEKMAFLDISDDTGSASAVIFPKRNDLIGKFIDGDLIKINVNIGERNNELQVIINDILEN